MLYKYNPVSINYSEVKAGTDDKHREKILMLIEEFEKNPSKTIAITRISDNFGIKRRRLYDIINVFSSIGCCQRSCLDHVQWLGKDKIYQEIHKQIDEREIYNPKLKLKDIFPINKTKGISNLTICFILLFYAQKTDRFDIRFAGRFFSEETNKYKTTLCKLYQITYILRALGVTKRSEQECEVMLESYYISFNFSNNKANNITSIEYLLNKPNGYDVEKYIIDRRDELRNCFISNYRGRVSFN